MPSLAHIAEHSIQQHHSAAACKSNSDAAATAARGFQTGCLGCAAAAEKQCSTSTSYKCYTVATSPLIPGCRRVQHPSRGLCQLPGPAPAGSSVALAQSRLLLLQHTRGGSSTARRCLPGCPLPLQMQSISLVLPLSGEGKMWCWLCLW